MTSVGLLQVRLNDCVVQSTKSLYSNSLPNVVLSSRFFDYTLFEIINYVGERIDKCKRF